MKKDNTMSKSNTKKTDSTEQLRVDVEAKVQAWRAARSDLEAERDALRATIEATERDRKPTAAIPLDARLARVRSQLAIHDLEERLARAQHEASLAVDALEARLAGGSPIDELRAEMLAELEAVDALAAELRRRKNVLAGRMIEATEALISSSSAAEREASDLPPPSVPIPPFLQRRKLPIRHAPDLGHLLMSAETYFRSIRRGLVLRDRTTEIAALRHEEKEILLALAEREQKAKAAAERVADFRRRRAEQEAEDAARRKREHEDFVAEHEAKRAAADATLAATRAS